MRFAFTLLAQRYDWDLHVLLCVASSDLFWQKYNLCTYHYLFLALPDIVFQCWAIINESSGNLCKGFYYCICTHVLLNVYVKVKSLSYALSVCSNTVDSVKPFSQVVVSVASQQYCVGFLVAPISDQNCI